MNKVILIGESHHHGLNLARSFGIEGIKPYGIIVNSNPGFLDACRYWEQIYHVANDEDAIRLVKELFENEIEKPLILPWSDGALFAIDQHLDDLKEHFYVSSIGGKQGEICRWLNKKRQADLAKEFGLSVSPTEEIQLPLQEADVQAIQDSFSFPLFLKPVDSREGSKNDMRRIDSVETLREYSHILFENGFHRILVQDYLKIDYEYDVMGYCHKEHYSYTVAKKIRTWPMNGGAACFGKVVAPGEKQAIFEHIIEQLIKLGYQGPFDMDLFQVGDKLYFNEINWRSSANVYAAVKSGNNYPYAWYHSVAYGANKQPDVYKGNDIYFMNEFWDVHHVMANRISLLKWLRDVMRTDTFAFSNKGDRKPFRTRMKNIFATKKPKRSF